MSTFIKNCYSIYSTLYLLWLVSAAIIISEEGFNFAKDAPWFLLFTSLLIFFWSMKYFLANDFNFFFSMKYFLANDFNFFFHKNISPLNKNAHIAAIFIMTFFMVWHS